MGVAKGVMGILGPPIQSHQKLLRIKRVYALYACIAHWLIELDNLHNIICRPPIKNSGYAHDLHP